MNEHKQTATILRREKREREKRFGYGKIFFCDGRAESFSIIIRQSAHESMIEQERKERKKLTSRLNVCLDAVKSFSFVVFMPTGHSYFVEEKKKCKRVAKERTHFSIRFRHVRPMQKGEQMNQPHRRRRWRNYCEWEKKNPALTE